MKIHFRNENYMRLNGDFKVQQENDLQLLILSQFLVVKQ